MNKIAYAKRVQTFITDDAVRPCRERRLFVRIFQSSQLDEERERIEGLTALYQTLFGMISLYWNWML